MPQQQIRLTKDQEEKLSGWLSSQLETIYTRRVARTQQWRKWREQYEGKVKAKNFPWTNASNVWVPQTAIDTDAVHANMMNRIFGHERVWDVESLKPALVVGVDMEDGQNVTWGDIAKATQSYMKFEAGPSGFMDIYKPVEEAILECIKLGTAVLYNPWVTLVQDDFVYDEVSGSFNREPRVVWDGLKPQNVPLEDFLCVPGYAEIHGPFGAPLFGHQYWLRRGQIINRKKEGKYRKRSLGGEEDPVARVLAAPGGNEEEDAKDGQFITEKDPGTFQTYRAKDEYLLQDLWVKYQLGGPDSFEVHLFVTYHAKTKTILRCEPRAYKTAPYHILRYILREGRLYGIGIPEMLETIQKGINTSFNQAVDNATIANIRCFKVKSGTKAARLFQDIYPGKKLLVDNMDDIMDFQLGEVYPSIFQVGLTLRDFGERRTGITDFNLGRESQTLGRSSTATTTMALLQEGSRRFDLYSKDIRRAIGELGMQSLELIAQMKPKARVFSSMDPEQAVLVEKAMDLPAFTNIREWLKVTTTTAASTQNKEVQRQNAVTGFGILTEYVTGILTQLAPVIGNPNVPEPFRNLALQAGQALERMMQNIMEGFDMPDIAAILPQLEGLLNGRLQGPPQAGGVGPAVGSPTPLSDGTQAGAGQGLQALSGPLGPAR